jgi:hypothetical protein
MLEDVSSLPVGIRQGRAFSDEKQINQQYKPCHRLVLPST